MIDRMSKRDIGIVKANLDITQERRLGKKCRAATCRWWDSELKDKSSLRREVYKKSIRGREDLWDEYRRLCKGISKAKEAYNVEARR